MSIYLSLIIRICLLLVQVIKFRFSPFISLLTSSIVIGLHSGLDGEIIINNIQQGMGSTLGYIAVIVGLGAMFGAILESTGGAKEITRYVPNAFISYKACKASTYTCNQFETNPHICNKCMHMQKMVTDATVCQIFNKYNHT